MWKEKERSGGDRKGGSERGTLPPTEMLSAQSIITTLFCRLLSLSRPTARLQRQPASDRTEVREGKEEGSFRREPYFSASRR